MVEVYLWTGFPGHLSLKVDGGNPPGPMYLSRFPATQLAKLAGTGVDQNYAQDLAEYGTPHIVRLSKLDETAVKKAVTLAQKTMLYSVPAANCASHVKFCLDSGVGGLAVLSVRGAIGFVISDTPWGVYAYAQSLRTLYG